MDQIKSLSISSSEIEFPTAATVFEKVPKLTLENQPLFNMHKKFPNLTHFIFRELDNKPACSLGIGK
jgi:hypothetical protein